MARIRDSRRLPGPNLLSKKPGAVLDIGGEDGEVRALVRVWEEVVRDVLDAVGWGAEETATRRFRRGASLFLSAPVDALWDPELTPAMTALGVSVQEESALELLLADLLSV